MRWLMSSSSRCSKVPSHSTFTRSDMSGTSRRSTCWRRRPIRESAPSSTEKRKKRRSRSSARVLSSLQAGKSKLHLPRLRARKNHSTFDKHKVTASETRRRWVRMSPRSEDLSKLSVAWSSNWKAKSSSRAFHRPYWTKTFMERSIICRNPRF